MQVVILHLRSEADRDGLGRGRRREHRARLPNARLPSAGVDRRAGTLPARARAAARPALGQRGVPPAGTLCAPRHGARHPGPGRTRGRRRPDVGDPDLGWPKPSGLPEDKRPRAGERKGLREACECIEQEALRSGWALRVALAHGGEPPRTFALRGINGVDRPIIALERGRAHELLIRGLKRAKLSEKEWQQRLRKAANAGRHETVPPKTFWSRPALTVSGTAPGILAQWEQACRQTTK